MKQCMRVCASTHHYRCCCAEPRQSRASAATSRAHLQPEELLQLRLAQAARAAGAALLDRGGRQVRLEQLALVHLHGEVSGVAPRPQSTGQPHRPLRTLRPKPRRVLHPLAFSSIVPVVSMRYTKQGLVWPSRQMRAMACLSMAG